MRLTPDLLLRAHHGFNPLKERELELRGLKIPAIENLGALQDQFDCIDFSDNEIRKVDNLPRMTRLTTLLFNNNYIRIVGSDLGNKIPNLGTLVLTNNRITSLTEIDHIASCKKLNLLSLIGNAVVHTTNYRLYVIHKIPSLKTLDFRKVKRQEREAAQKLFASSEGKALVALVAEESKTQHNDSTTKAMNGSRSGELTEDQKRQIQEAIKAAKTPAEIDRIERQLNAGTFPFSSPANSDTQPSKKAKIDIDDIADPSQPANTQNVAELEPSVEMQVEVQASSNDEASMQLPMAVMQGEELDNGNEEQQQPSATAGLTIEEAKKLKVPELKEQLQLRGLSVQGLKADLQNRLFAVLTD